MKSVLQILSELRIRRGNVSDPLQVFVELYYSQRRKDVFNDFSSCLRQGPHGPAV